MFRIVASLILFVATFAQLSSASPKKEVFLPPDCDITVVGDGFKLELTQFAKMKENWNEVAESAAQVETPRHAGEQEVGVVDANLYEETKKQGGETKGYGPIENDLLAWISSRAASLVSRIERYNQELGSLDKQGHRIVNEILLLNTLVNIENLNKENIPALKWVKNKLKVKLNEDVPRGAFTDEIYVYVDKLIAENKDLERAVRGKNTAGPTWVKNTQSLRRILHEQRFSDSLNKLIVSFLSDNFNFMKRSTVFDKDKPAYRIEDGLFYDGARGIVPLTFPFSAQDAIVNGAYV